MIVRATGTFEVKLLPLPMDSLADDASFGRMSIDKQYFGDLVGASNGEMLSARSSVPGSAGYVAIERVTGKVADRQGSFILQHSSIMSRGTPTQSIVVVPDSATGGLAGLSGTMTIRRVGEQHHYDLDMTLPEVV